MVFKGLAVRWEKPESYEARIRSGECEWVFDEISIHAIHWDRSQRNQARLGVSVRPEVVAAMCTAMQETTAIFPAVIVHEATDLKASAVQRYVIIDGNHRASAYAQLVEQHGAPQQIQVFKVTGDASDLDLLTRSWNAQESMGQPVEEKQAHIREAIYRDSTLSNQRLAKQFACSTDFVNRIRKAHETALRLDKLRVNHDTPRFRFNDSHYRVLAGIHEDELLKTVGNAIVDYRLNASRAEELMQTIPRKSALAKKQRLVAEYCTNFVEQHSRPNGQVTKRRTPEARNVQRQLTTLINQLKRTGSYRSLGIKQTIEKKRFWQKMQELQTLLTKFELK